MEGIMIRDHMEIPNGMSRLVRLVEGEAMIEEEDPTMEEEVDMGTAAEAHTSII